MGIEAPHRVIRRHRRHHRDSDGVGLASYPAPERRHFMSSISVIGLGNMASALAERALAGGNAVEIIGRDSTKAKEVAAALDGATVGTAGATPAGEIVILAVPYAGAAAVVREY